MKTEFECEFCKGCFTKKYLLEMHLKFHTKKGLFKCPSCDLTFLRKSELLFHQKIHGQRDKGGPKKPNRYQCPHCYLDYSDKQTLQKHIAVHLREAEFDCYFCEKAFHHKHLRTAHEKKVHLKLKRQSPL